MRFIKVVALIVTVFLIAAGCTVGPAADSLRDQKEEVSAVNDEGATQESDAEIVAPISHAKDRVIKKPFGLKVSPSNSPVKPEKFTGYHSGVDFEAFPDEKDSDVVISAVCSGKLATKRTAQGYGGLVTQQCTIDGEPVTVIYGHMRLSSVQVAIGSELKAGDRLGLLGTGYSVETDNERKHLHLGIVKGHGSDIRGYVSDPSLLSSFLDITKYL